jgi:hypothetical protein
MNNKITWEQIFDKYIKSQRRIFDSEWLDECELLLKHPECLTAIDFFTSPKNDNEFSFTVHGIKNE